MFKANKLTLTVILILALIVRLYGLNWDDGHLLHPDERFLTMVTNDSEWPTSLSEYFDPKTSPLNPRNAGYGFFVYGTFPLFLTKTLSDLSGAQSLQDIVLFGRLLSALFDLGTVFLVYLTAKKIIPQPSNYTSNRDEVSGSGLEPRTVAMLSAFFYGIAVLPIQLSHFFTVDTFLTFFLTLSFYFLVKGLSNKSEIRNTKYETNLNDQNPNLQNYKRFWLLSNLNLGFVLRQAQDVVDGKLCRTVSNFDIRASNLISVSISFGIALATKISALLFLPIIAIYFFVIFFMRPHKKYDNYFSKLLTVILTTVLFAISVYTIFRFFNPYAFSTGNLFNPTPNPQFINNLKTLQSYSSPDANFPPGVQWIKSRPILFPLRNLLYYGLGLPLGLLAIGGIIHALAEMAKWLNSHIVKFLKSKTARFKFSSFIFHFSFLLVLLWTFGLFFFQSFQFAKNMRYFLPIYPYLAIFAAHAAVKLIKATCPAPERSDLCGTKKTPISRGFFSVGEGPYPYLLDTYKTIIYRFKAIVKSVRRTRDLNPTPTNIGAHYVSSRSGTLPVHSPHYAILTYLFLICVVSIWPLAFLSIYSRPHTRIAASHWIYENILEGSTLTCERWDDCLPLSTGGYNPASKYHTLQLPLYDPDTPKKWDAREGTIPPLLAKADYLILSSNRLYGSISSVPEKYPTTAEFYRRLFREETLPMAGGLQFTKIAEFTSRPSLRYQFQFSNFKFQIPNICITPPFEWYGKISETSCNGAIYCTKNCTGLTIIDDYADESFTVYDHPKVIIFKKL